MSDMPKRERDLASSDGSGSPDADRPQAPLGGSTVQSEPLQPCDAQLEATLGRLELDDDFKDSIRALSPTSQREVVNDIVRQQQQERATAFLGGEDSAYGRHGGGIRLDEFLGEDDEDEEVPEAGDYGEGEEEEYVDVGDDENDTDADELFARHLAEQFNRENTNPMAALLQELLPALFAGQPQGRDGVHVGANAFLNGQPMAAGRRQGVPTPLDMLRQHLQNALGELQQVSAMQAMGIDRDIDDMSYEDLLALEERLGSVSKGLSSEAEIEACYVPLAEPPKDRACPICIEEFSPSSATVTPTKEDGADSGATSRSLSVQEVRPCVSLKNCGHAFHEVCLKPWLQNSKTCPVCKQEVIPHDK